MNKRFARITMILLLCVSNAAIGDSVITSFEGGIQSTSTPGQYLGYASINATTNPCALTLSSASSLLATCTYGTSTTGSMTSTFDAIGVGIGVDPGVFFDPIIVELWATVHDISGTYDNGQGFSGPLVITSGLSSVPIDMNANLLAEPNTQLVIVDLPPGAPFGTYRFTFNYTGPPAIRAVFAARVQAGGKTFYPPIMPCVTDFATVPYFTFSPNAPPEDLLTPTLLSQVHGCDHKVFTFASGGLPATVDVIEYYAPSLDHYFITWVPAEIAALDSGTIKGWQRTGYSFKTYPTAQAGTTPVCRYYLPPQYGDSHFFGRGTVECNATGLAHPGFILEDPMFMQMFLPSAGNCPANTTPVYRVFSNRLDANHRYMTDRAVRDHMIALGWLAEGDGPDLVVMCAPQ